MEETQQVFTAIFDQNSPNWNPDPDYNRVFLACQQNYFNHRLDTLGHVFLNEIHDALGLKRTSVGQLVGWISKDSSSHIDFAVEFEDDPAKIELTFNVDGIIYEEIE